MTTGGPIPRPPAAVNQCITTIRNDPTIRQNIVERAPRVDIDTDGLFQQDQIQAQRMGDLMLQDVNLATQIAATAQVHRTDFLFTPTGSCEAWGITALSSGTVLRGTGSAKHPGIATISSSPSANSGGSILTNKDALLLIGGEKTTFIFQMTASLYHILRYMGFHNAIDHTGLTDGVYLMVNDNVLSGVAKDNNSAASTATTFALTADTWYRATVELAADLSKATFTLYADDTSTVLWQDTVTTKIPKTRTTGHGDICFSTGTSAEALGSLDYMDICLPGTRKIV